MAFLRVRREDDGWHAVERGVLCAWVWGDCRAHVIADAGLVSPTMPRCMWTTRLRVPPTVWEVLRLSSIVCPPRASHLCAHLRSAPSRRGGGLSGCVPCCTPCVGRSEGERVVCTPCAGRGSGSECASVRIPDLCPHGGACKAQWAPHMRLETKVMFNVPPSPLRQCNRVSGRGLTNRLRAKGGGEGWHCCCALPQAAPRSAHSHLPHTQLPVVATAKEVVRWARQHDTHVTGVPAVARPMQRRRHLQVALHVSQHERAVLLADDEDGVACGGRRVRGV